MQASPWDPDAPIRLVVLVLAASSVIAQIAGSVLFFSAFRPSLPVDYGLFAIASALFSLGSILVLVGFLVLGWGLYARARRGLLLATTLRMDGLAAMILGVVCGTTSSAILFALSVSRGVVAGQAGLLAAQVLGAFALPLILVGLTFQLFVGSAVPTWPPFLAPAEPGRNP